MLPKMRLILEVVITLYQYLRKTLLKVLFRRRQKMTRKEFLHLIDHINKIWSPPGIPSDDQPNQQLIREAFCAWLSLSVDLNPQLTLKKCLHWLDNLSKYDFKDIMEDCKTLISFAINKQKRPRSVCAFKGHPWQCNCKQIFSPIWEKIVQLITSEECIGEVYQWAKFLTKLPIDNPDLQEESLNKWLQIEEDLSRPTADPNEREKYFFSQPFRFPPDRRGFRPMHSGGAVAERGLETYLDKYVFCRPVKQLYGLHRSKWFYPPIDKEAEMTSRLTFVPKTVFALRAIAMEPAGLMYFQQGWKHEIYKNIERASYGSIHFDDQRYNQRLCRFASENGCYATIDFSSASDTVKLSLVQKLCESTDMHPLWRHILLDGRSSYCELPDGGHHKLVKYAAMGSTFTFPMETLIFYAVAASLVEQEYGTFPAAPQISIFGDDCIIPSGLSEQFYERTRELGFIPNEEKSYTSGPFRESCGCDVYNGEVITPLLFRIPLKERNNISARNQSIIALCNHSQLRGYSHLREYAISLAEKGTPFSSDIDNYNAIYTENPYTTKYRVNGDRQVLQYKALTPQNWGARDSAFSSEQLLQEWLRLREYTDPDYMPDLNCAIPPTSSDTWRWLDY